mmetsp:Transcript_10608/g.39540  ORF Transcript_10608/g.39540 Transcript_10608/m.39540 type:complete len:307 (-) Transcript_10608:169-1089(-)|eukprot:CAMPEP_0117437382 /NCGR_PEP_ID=MMETSP0759-20121206/1494_1 /TAXON_ID=63605 /ORGANISM="Percolomonas cosmopolitus, Strain WS" /LENGTH=306 /DNA_ID=CAMNT_0005229011 /DNA_START=96 /DNA_END=1016 /DNA_ORIENTATION=-
MAKLSQKLLIFIIISLLLLITLANASNLDSISDDELDLEDDEEDIKLARDMAAAEEQEPVGSDQDVPDMDEFDPENLTPEQLEMLRQYQQQQQQQEIFSSPDVESSWVLPPRNERRLALGDESKLVLGFTNTGSDNFQVLGVRGAIVSPMDYSFVIQNLTGIRYNSTVQPEETNSLFYNFVPDKRLDVEPREYGMLVVVYYMNDDNTTFATTFFNETVTFYDARSGAIDFQRIFMFLVLIGFVVGAGYVAMQRVQKSASGGSRSGARKAKSSAALAEDDTEVNYNHIPARLRKRFQNSSPSSPKSS